jgi:hypothetical protein
MKKSLFSAFGAAILALAAVGTANASITVGGVPTITGGPGAYVWTYSSALDASESITSGSYFVIYDFAGYVSGSVFAPTGWTASVQLVGPLPAGQGLPDNSTLENLVFTYTGANATGPIGSLGSFGATSVYGGSSANKNGVFAYTAVNTGLGSNDEGQGNTETPTVPEPMTMSLVGGGLALLGAIRLRRKA